MKLCIKNISTSEYLKSNAPHDTEFTLAQNAHSYSQGSFGWQIYLIIWLICAT